MSSDGDAASQVFENMRWIDPVEDPADLPTEGVREGSPCFVSGSGAIYRFEKGRWVLESEA